MLIAYHGNAALKEKIRKRVLWHQERDHIARGRYTQGSGRSFRGCAVGCSLEAAGVEKSMRGDHKLYEIKLGIPRIIALLEDKLFESLPFGEHVEFPLKFIDAIPVGADLSNVWPQFAAWLMIDETWGVLRRAETDKQRAIITEVAKKFSANITDRKTWEEIHSRAAKLRVAAVAAYTDAVYTYAVVAAAAAAAAASHDAAVASHDAAVAAAAAAAASHDAAVAVYASAAYGIDAHGKHLCAQRDKLLEILAAAPVVAQSGGLKPWDAKQKSNRTAETSVKHTSSRRRKSANS